MKALSILQPWAWLIVNGWKPVENRTWQTRFRGPLLIHAGKRWGREQRDDLAWVRLCFPHIHLPAEFELGGIVGSATVTDCVSDMDSRWFFGPYGFVLSDPRAFNRVVPCKGALGLFNVPPEVAESLRSIGGLSSFVPSFQQRKRS